jgi:hypothetical protein
VEEADSTADRAAGNIVDAARSSGDSEGSDDRKVGCNMTSVKVTAVLRSFRGVAIGSAVVLFVSFCTYHLHFNLSAAASLDILIILFITLWFGFWQATATSFAAVACFCLLGLFLRSTNSELLCRRPSQLGGPRSL